MNKIAIVTTGHPPFDDRIYWKFAKSLSINNSVAVFCSTLEIDTISSNIKILGFNSNLNNSINKHKKLFDYLLEFEPDIIICSEISAIISAYRFKLNRKNKCKIISDITEWYPENIVSKLSGFTKIFKYLLIYTANIVLTNLTNALIIGEQGKKSRYQIIAPFKKKVIIGYYPILEYFKYKEKKIELDNFNLGYAGVINFKRGILTLLDVFVDIQIKYPLKDIKLIIAGKFDNLEEERAFLRRIKDEKLSNIEFLEWTDYNNISDHLSKMDVCFDLRELTFIYNNSLPIKFFEYLASGKPVIYSAVKPLKKLGVDKFGFLVDPTNKEQIISVVEKYMTDKELYMKHSKNARGYIEKGNNWEEESKKLINFINFFCIK
ncbi:MAG: hypothetical protein CO128_04505 [Ignavibacteriales bacterium CG_4_9_14_3_um_filter_30_11]|nr:MAG: hypothetical protein CO128_04505 [Ignavibacteriales bacterium CG_4_9_14_3_um_filter_30_11]